MTRGGKSLKCPECGRAATGKFCQECGAKLGSRFCNQCGEKLAPSAAFCNQCGAKVGGSHRGAAAAAAMGGKNLPWWIGGFAMIGLIVFGLVSYLPSGAPAGPAGMPPAGVPAGLGPPPDISSMTPRERADQLYDRVMRSVSTGDSVEAQFFLPMAIEAYQLARPLDHDGLFHMSLLNRTAMNLEAALDNALEVLEEDPNHVLALSAAAEAAVDLGLLDEAEGYYRYLVDVFERETARALTEYERHSPIMESARAAAEAFLAAR